MMIDYFMKEKKWTDRLAKYFLSEVYVSISVTVPEDLIKVGRGSLQGCRRICLLRGSNEGGWGKSTLRLHIWRWKESLLPTTRSTLHHLQTKLGSWNLHPLKLYSSDCRRRYTLLMEMIYNRRNIIAELNRLS